MQRKSLVRRLLTPEMACTAVVGAAAPYLVALLIKIAPTRVPLWLVLTSVLGCALVVGAVQGLIARHRRAQQRIDRLEQKIAEIAPGSAISGDRGS